MEYYIYITNDCNMDCSYCSVLFDTNKFGIPKTPQYSFDELEKFISLTQEQLNDKVADIYFFGGEPTMDYNAISKLMVTMNKPHKYEVNYILHTNALRLKQAPDDVLKNIALTVLSVNYELMYRQNHLTDYFDTISKAVKHLKSKNNSPIIGRFTISPKTSLYSECCLLVNVFDYIYWQIDNCDSFPNSYVGQYKSDIKRLFEYWLSFLHVGVFLNFVPFITALGRYINDTPIPTEYYCGYGKSMIYVQTNGKCYACCDSVASETHLIGNIYEGISFPKIDISQSVCGDCSCIKICGGRCGRMHREFSKEHIKEYCDMNKFMFDIIETSLPEITELIKKYPEYKAKINNPIFAYTEYTA
ncbi:MAG: radical SAM protein [Firmicutes bacterium]|nr:radical SAM protein [Bacillota bacterium]